MPPLLLRLLLCLSALAALCPGLMVQPCQEACLPDKEIFFACEEEGLAATAECPPSRHGVPSRHMDELLEAGYRRMREVASRGRRPLAVHIGADGLRNPARWTDMHLYRRVLERAGLPPDTLRLAFVEPMASKSGTFWKHVGQLPVNTSQVALLTAVIDNPCRPFTRVFRVKLAAALEFDFDIQMLSGWVSADRDHLMETVQTWLDSNAPVACLNQTGDCRANLRRLWNMRNVSHYTEDVFTGCLTLEGLVRHVGAEVEDLAMLVSDAEGTDARIILSLVGSEDFRPGFIMWEKNSQGDGQLVEELRKKGYQVGIKAGLDGSREVDAGNLVAVLS